MCNSVRATSSYHGMLQFLADFAPNGSLNVDRLKYCSAVLLRME